MTWELIAYDIAASIENDAREDLLAEARELADAERATQLFADRIRALTGREALLSVSAPDLSFLSGILATSGDDWLLLRDAVFEYLVLAHAITRLHSPTFAREAPDGLPVSLSSMLRELQGSHVTINCIDSTRTGVITGVGKDYLVLDEGDNSARRGSYAPDWEPRYAFAANTERRLVAIPFRAIAVISQVIGHGHEEPLCAGAY